MLPFPSASELARRLPRLFLGLVLFGIGVSMTLVAGLGVSPWTVFHEGVAKQTGLRIGTVVVITGVFVLLLWIPLRERIGIGSVSNVLTIGPVINITLDVLPETVTVGWHQWAFMLGGTFVVALGSGFYIGAGLGPGPRDGVMTGLARRGINIGVARIIVEVTALSLGWLLGGTVGVGTVVFAFGVGPLIGILLPRLRMEPVPEKERRAPGANHTQEQE